jgi:hypothetical protein
MNLIGLAPAAVGSAAPTRRLLVRWTLIATLALSGLFYLLAAAGSLALPRAYYKDFLSPYLLGSAILRGLNPYLPLPDLAEGFLRLPDDVAFFHASPHPPTVALLSAPFALLPYQQAASVWFVLEVVGLALVVRWLLREFRPGSSLPLVGLVVLLLLSWSPFWTELVVGQLMILLLVLLTAAWLALRADRSAWGGALLGLMVAVKLIAWPIVLWLALQRNWRAVAAASAPVLATHALAAPLIGWETIVDYYLRIGPSVGVLYRAESSNMSVFSLGWRLFSGTGSGQWVGLLATPLVSWPAAAHSAALLVPAALLLLGLALALRARSFDAAFGLLVCVSAVAAPVAWAYYLVLLTLPVVFVLERLAALGWPRRETGFLAVIAAAFYVSPPQLHQIALLLAGEAPDVRTATVIPFLPSLVTLLPLVAVLALLALIWHLDRIDSAPQYKTGYTEQMQGASSLR